jgi:hypothetical protein
MEQYEVTCREIERFAMGKGRTEYYDGLMEDYTSYIESREKTAVSAKSMQDLKNV